MTRETLGQRVKRLRKRAKLSQDGLARAMGMTRQHVHELETGGEGNLRLDSIQRYAAALDVSEHYLLTGEEPGHPEQYPEIDSYLRATSDLDEEQISYIRRSLDAMRAERELADLQAEYAALTEHEERRVAEDKAAYSEPDLAEEMHRQQEEE